MTAVVAPTGGSAAKTGPRAGMVGLAMVPAAIVVVASAFVGTFAGYPERLGGAYQPLMNAGVLLRGFGMFLSVVVVWGALRARGASRPLLALAILSGPVAYGIVAAIGMLDYFPPGQAAYYGINPIFIATIGGQCAMAAVAEMVWRWRSRRRGQDNGRVPIAQGHRRIRREDGPCQLDRRGCRGGHAARKRTRVARCVAENEQSGVREDRGPCNGVGGPE